MSERVLIFLEVFVVFVILVVGLIANFEEIEWLRKIYASIDLPISVAIGIVSIFAYFEYRRYKNKTLKFLKQMKLAKSSMSKKGAILIKFGTRANFGDLEEFIETKKIAKEVILKRDFGDDIVQADIAKLTEFLSECRKILSSVDEVEIIYAGLNVGAFVIADNLKNWKQLNFYHHTGKGANYELWYSDEKHRQKLSDSISELNDRITIN